MQSGRKLRTITSMNLINLGVEQFWNSFPFLFEPIQDFFNGNFFRVLKRQLKGYPTKSILDFGCGVGSLLSDFNPKIYVGVDINPAFIHLARHRYAHRPNTAFVCTDALKFRSKKRFDIVTMVSMIHHFPDQQLTSLLDHLSRNIKFRYLLVIDGKPTATIWKPLLQFLDLGADFRDFKEILPFFKKNFAVIKKGNLRSNKHLYYYPFILAKNRRTA